MFDAKTCPTCDGEGVMYELPGEPYCETCDGCGDVALDGSRPEVLSHGALQARRHPGARLIPVPHDLRTAEAEFQKDGWVARRDWQQLAQIKEFIPPGGALEPR